ncbi:MAG: MATE family efflux transporter [Eubacteriales bacterium]|nr:MATE family efflux transporter [Eubacteriales bacterium]
MHLRRKVRQNRLGLDMTQGKMLPQILAFAGPLMLTGILQLLYNAADVVVVGRFAGAQALAAVGSTGALINLIVNLFTGVATGAGVAVARAYGASDYRLIQKSVHTAITLAIISGIAVLILGQLLARPLLEWMDSPEDVIDLTELYLRIYFIGMPAAMLYNFGAAILRAVGDTRRPLYYLMLSGLVNVILNLILVIVFNMSVAGVAIATVASQVISMVLVMICLIRTHGAIHLDLHRLKIDRPVAMGMLRIGLPAGVQGMFFSISNVLIQSAVNSFGSVAMAGNAAAGNLEGFAYTAMNSFHQADVTISSQNMGAKKYARVRRTIWLCLGCVMVSGLAMAGLLIGLGEPLLSLYNTDPEVIRYGMLRMICFLPTYVLCGTMEVVSGQLRGIGYSLMPMLVTLTGVCAFRVVWLQTAFVAWPSLETVYISYPISWGLTTVAHLLCYLLIACRKLPKHDEPSPA